MDNQSNGSSNTVVKCTCMSCGKINTEKYMDILYSTITTIKNTSIGLLDTPEDVMDIQGVKRIFICRNCEMAGGTKVGLQFGFSSILLLLLAVFILDGFFMRTIVGIIGFGMLIWSINIFRSGGEEALAKRAKEFLTKELGDKYKYFTITEAETWPQNRTNLKEFKKDSKIEKPGIIQKDILPEVEKSDKLIGGFEEPYCSDICLKNAGGEITQRRMVGQTGNCAFCQTEVKASVDSIGECVFFPYRQALLFVCKSCINKGKEHVQKIDECCMCGVKL